MKYVILNILLIGFIQVSIAQNSGEILFVGDSFTAGKGIEKTNTFVYLVGEKLNNTETINQGRSGWPTSAYLRRWEEVAESLPKSAARVFIQLGGNDLRVDGHSKETIAKCRKNMEEIVDRLQSVLPSTKIVLMSSVKVEDAKLTDKIREAGFGKYSNKYLKRIGKTYQQLAKEKGLGYLDLIAELPKENTYDGVHLNEVGHKVVARIILDYLKKISD